MSPDSELSEYRRLHAWLPAFKRGPRQINRRFESDVEILKLNSRQYLCFSTDALAEEIELGIYRDPYLQGWVAAAGALSDLVVSGASPLGVLTACEWATDWSNARKKRVMQGHQDALRKAKVALIGGDSGTTATTVLTTTIIGLKKSPPLTRLGLKAGDRVAILGKPGLGPALGLSYMLQDDRAHRRFENQFRPRSRFELASLSSGDLRAAIDTSDGIMSCLTILANLNRVAFQLVYEKSALDPTAVSYFLKKNFHPLTSWYCQLGDFQPLLVIPQERWKKVKQRLPDLQMIGEVRPLKEGSTVTFLDRRKTFEIELDWLDRKNPRRRKDYLRAVTEVDQHLRTMFNS